MFGPETNIDKEQNTLSSVAFAILSYRKAIGKLRKNYISSSLSVHKFQQPVSSTTQKSELSTVWFISHIYFQLWLERGECRGMPNRERKRVPDDRSDILKGPLTKSPPAHPLDTKNPSIWGWLCCFVYFYDASWWYEYFFWLEYAMKVGGDKVFAFKTYFNDVFWLFKGEH